MKHIKLFEQFVNEASVANQWGIESHHIGGLQKGKVDKYTEGRNIMPFGLISSAEGGISDTDKALVKDYIDADHIVLKFYPMEDPNNDTMYDAVKSEAVKVIEKLIKDEYDLKLLKTLKGKRHCSGSVCSVTHYLVFAK